MLDANISREISNSKIQGNLQRETNSEGTAAED